MAWLRLIVLLFLTALSFDMGQRTPEQLNPLGKLIASSFLVWAPLLYLLPTAEAWKRGHGNLAALGALNVLLGWTLVGWVAAFVWALMRSAAKPAAPPEPAAPPYVSPPWPPAQHRAPVPPAPAPTTKTCPYCAEQVLLAAIKCKHCGSELKPAES